MAKVRQQLAAELGVSRTPLREAIRVLVNDGLLAPEPASGTVRVVEFSSDEVLELYQVREIVDGLAARLCAAADLAPQTKQTLEDSLRRFAASCDPFDLTAYVTTHAEFQRHDPAGLQEQPPDAVGAARPDERSDALSSFRGPGRSDEEDGRRSSGHSEGDPRQGRGPGRGTRPSAHLHGDQPMGSRPARRGAGGGVRANRL
jgi:hypothetical protein